MELSIWVITEEMRIRVEMLDTEIEKLETNYTYRGIMGDSHYNKLYGQRQALMSMISWITIRRGI